MAVWFLDLLNECSKGRRNKENTAEHRIEDIIRPKALFLEVSHVFGYLADLARDLNHGTLLGTVEQHEAQRYEGGEHILSVSANNSRRAIGVLQNWPSHSSLTFEAGDV